MVERQLRRRGIDDERVLAAMEEVPRERFLDPDLRGDAYRDGAVAIAEGQTMSQPWIVARMTSLLELRGHERVLEVGTGSGYGAAVLSRCCAEVVTIERHAELADRARAVLSELGFRNVEVRASDGSRGAPDRAPFDAIIVTAVAEEEPPRALGEHAPCAIGQLLVALDRHHLAAAARQHRRPVARARPDLEHALIRRGHGEHRHARHDPRLRHRLALPDRHGAVAVRVPAHVLGQEALARNLAHRAEHALVLDPAAAQLVLDHPRAAIREGVSRCSS